MALLSGKSRLITRSFLKDQVVDYISVRLYPADRLVSFNARMPFLRHLFVCNSSYDRIHSIRIASILDLS